MTSATGDRVDGNDGRPGPGRAASGSPTDAVRRTQQRPLIGILGGLGPAATLDLYAKVLALTPAASDQDHVRLIIDADPQVPDRNESVAGRGPSSAPALVAKALRLKAAGAELLAMACNAAHAYQDEIVAATLLPFLSIVEEAVKAASQRGGSGPVGLLATTGTLDAGLYQGALARAGRVALLLEDRQLDDFMALIYRVKGGDTGAEVSGAMLSLAEALRYAGASSIIAACTEVPLVLDDASRAALELPIIDATSALASAIVAAGAASTPGA